jgi:DNA-binding response OmpR family regulator
MSDTPGQPHVLAMDQSWEVLNLIRDVLAESGFTVTTGLLADQTIDIIATLAPDVIIMDYMYALEGRSRDLFETLKQDRRTAHIPIILCTGAVPETEDIREELEHLGVRVVYKPFDIDDLVGTVQACLNEV